MAICGNASDKKIMERTTKSNAAAKSSIREEHICSILERCTIKNGKIVTHAFLQEILDNVNITALSRAGNTVIHDVVAADDTRVAIENRAEIINELVTRGVDIDHQNKEGKTALHLAAIFGNREGALGLLKNGADINIADAKGKTPFAISYKKSSFDICEDSEDEGQDSSEEIDFESFDGVFTMIAKHAHKLRYCELHLNELNHRLLSEGAIYKYLRCSEFDSFHGEVERTKLITLGSHTLSLYEFLFKVDSESLYFNMNQFQRQEIDEFFENIDRHNLTELDCIIQLRYKEITQRIRLTERALALDSLNILIDEYQLPDLCCRHIFKYLTNVDLKNLILSKG